MVLKGALRHRSKICFDLINRTALIYKATRPQVHATTGSTLKPVVEGKESSCHSARRRIFSSWPNWLHPVTAGSACRIWYLSGLFLCMGADRSSHRLAGARPGPHSRTTLHHRRQSDLRLCAGAGYRDHPVADRLDGAGRRVWRSHARDAAGHRSGTGSCERLGWRHRRDSGRLAVHRGMADRSVADHST